MSFQAAYIPIGVGTFHLESAQKEFEASVALLKSLSQDVVCPDKMLLTLDDLSAFLDTIQPDVIVLQNITFANAAYASEVLKRFSCPILLWTLREPVIDGGRLRLNSLTGARVRTLPTPPPTPSTPSGARGSLNMCSARPRTRTSGRSCIQCSRPQRSCTACAV